MSCSLLLAVPLCADTSGLLVPALRGSNSTAYAEWDTFSGLSTVNGTGSASPDAVHQLTGAVLTQSSPLSFPGGLKYTTATDLRVYTFDSATNWTLSGTSDVGYNRATLRTVELLDSSRGDGEEPVGLTDYSVTLNTVLPASTSTEARTETVTINGYSFDRDIAITTFIWELPQEVTALNLILLGPADSHDSLDAFVLDLENVSELPTPQISVAGNQVTVLWPESSSATLQSSDDITDSHNWLDVTTGVGIVNGFHSITFTAGAVPTFFRFRQ